MIITTTKPARAVSDTNQMIDKIVKGRMEKMTNETIDELKRINNWIKKEVE